MKKTFLSLVTITILLASSFTALAQDDMRRPGDDNEIIIRKKTMKMLR